MQHLDQIIIELQDRIEELENGILECATILESQDPDITSKLSKCSDILYELIGDIDA